MKRVICLVVLCLIVALKLHAAEPEKSKEVLLLEARALQAEMSLMQQQYVAKNARLNEIIGVLKRMEAEEKKAKEDKKGEEGKKKQ